MNEAKAKDAPLQYGAEQEAEISRARAETAEDRKILEAGLNDKEFVEVSSLPSEKRKEWWRVYEENMGNACSEQKQMRTIRQELYLLLQVPSDETPLSPEECQAAAYKQFGSPAESTKNTSIFQAMPLFKNSDGSCSFDFLSQKAWQRAKPREGVCG